MQCKQYITGRFVDWTTFLNPRSVIIPFFSRPFFNPILHGPLLWDFSDCRPLRWYMKSTTRSSIKGKVMTVTVVRPLQITLSVGKNIEKQGSSQGLEGAR